MSGYPFRFGKHNGELRRAILAIRHCHIALTPAVVAMLGDLTLQQARSAIRIARKQGFVRRIDRGLYLNAAA